MDKLKFTLTGSIVFLGISIILGSCQISNAIMYHSDRTPNYEDDFTNLNHYLDSLKKSR